MCYFYFNPLNPQYFFPDTFEKYPLLLNFYKPYNRKGSIMWWLWNFRFIRKFYKIDNLGPIIPEQLIRMYCGENNILAFNIGKQGPEQKITVLGIDNVLNNEFFMKFAQTALSMSNVQNESTILKYLSHLDFVPKIMDHVSSTKFELLKTSILQGERCSNFKVSTQLLDILLQLSAQKITPIKNYQSEVDTCFAHGDFCPWNLMKSDGKIQVFDWELAGNYPIGYDLFTFIFQTSFLLQPRENINKIILKNKPEIDLYFRAMRINNWKPYLIAFAKLKYSLEVAKKDSNIYLNYNKLISYAEKA